MAEELHHQDILADINHLYRRCTTRTPRRTCPMADTRVYDAIRGKRWHLGNACSVFHTQPIYTGKTGKLLERCSFKKQNTVSASGQGIPTAASRRRFRISCQSRSIAKQAEAPATKREPLRPHLSQNPTQCTIERVFSNARISEACACFHAKLWQAFSVLRWPVLPQTLPCPFFVCLLPRASAQGPCRAEASFLWL